jgi:hypothetical protein
VLDHALRAARNRERHAQHARGVGALIIRARVAITPLAEVPLDAELRVFEQVFVHRVLARDRNETVAVACSERITLK